MVKVREDLTGKYFGYLKVVKQVEDYINPKGQHFSQWLCECKCGNKDIIVRGAHLKDRSTQSCGCLNRKRSSEAHRGDNLFNLDGDFGIGYTAKGEEFWFDKEDYELINKYCWRYDKNGYVVATNYETCKIIKLHRLVMKITEKDIKVDHKSHPPRDEHKYDNRKANLQIVTDSENAMNRTLQSNNTSGTTGVYWHKKDCKWVMSIQVKGKRITQEFDRREDAITARKEAEIKYFGEHRYDANNGTNY